MIDENVVYFYVVNCFECLFIVCDGLGVLRYVLGDIAFLS